MLSTRSQELPCMLRQKQNDAIIIYLTHESMVYYNYPYRLELTVFFYIAARFESKENRSAKNR